MWSTERGLPDGQPAAQVRQLPHRRPALPGLFDHLTIIPGSGGPGLRALERQAPPCRHRELWTSNWLARES